MNKSEVIQQILGKRYHQTPQQESGEAFAPTNIALCKYWGKRDQELNLPVTSSLSISLKNKGAVAKLQVISATEDEIFVNNRHMDPAQEFSLRLVSFLNLFRPAGGPFFSIHILSNIPIAAGLASSACGFASIVQALNQLYGWSLAPRELSILARLGSGSASRSLWHGFVEWHAGEDENGMDSFAEPIEQSWPDFCMGLLIMDTKEKPISSRTAMQRTVESSPLYRAWPSKVNMDMLRIKLAITEKDITLLGETAESNALSMHATMLSAWPPISYTIPETLTAMQTIWQWREQGKSIYFTQDAGPNLKLLFLKQDSDFIQKHFPQLEIIQPFVAL